MSNKSKLITLSIGLILIVFIHWFFGTTILTKYSYFGFDKNEYGNKALQWWISSLSENNRNYLKKLWPKDTITAYSSGLQLNVIQQNEFILIPHKIENFLPMDAPWIRIELDYKEKNPFFYNFNIFGICNLDKNDSTLVPMKMKIWGVSFIGCRYHWIPFKFIGFKPGEINGIKKY